MNTTSIESQLIIQNEGKIYGYDTAMKWLMEQKDDNTQPTDILLDLKKTLESISIDNMFDKYDGAYVHRQAFDFDENSICLEIKLGGQELNLRVHSSTKLTTISSVQISKEIQGLCKNKELASVIANQIKTLHKKSFQEGSRLSVNFKNES